MKHYLGIDYHKKFSYVALMDETGKLMKEGRVENSFLAWQQLAEQLPGDCHAVFEAGRTWGVLYQWLEDLDIPTVIAHPKRVRAIAETKIKTDKLDARVLAHLLRADLVPAIHVPARLTRDHRHMLRYRLRLVKIQTQIKNRVHVLLDLYTGTRPSLTDLFGKAGRLYLENLELPEPGQTLLDRHLGLLDVLHAQIRQIEAWLKQHIHTRPDVRWLQTIPGFGPILSVTAALEIDRIDRFAHPNKLSAYAGLVPSTYQSSTRLFHGATLRDCNHWLKMAFIEAAWSAIRSSAYCQHFYQQRCRRKPPAIAIVALANRLAHIVYAVLTQQRPYEERPILQVA